MKLSSIKKNPDNPRIIKDDKFSKLVNSIKQFPKMMELRPMVIDSDGMLLGGNMRRAALESLGYKEVPDSWVKRANDLTEEEKQRFIIADNVGFGDWEWDTLANEWDSGDLSDWGLDVFVFDAEEQEEEALENDPTNNSVWIPDCLFESNNKYDIPTLKPELQATELLLPFKGWGVESRQKTTAAVWHFYVDDYRFEALWTNPEKVVGSGCTSIIEPNLSLYDTTPISYGIHLIYKKRWLARLMQKFGITIFADLNVSVKFAQYNRLGIPEGWNAFCTRGYSGKEAYLESEIKIAQEISGLDAPFMVVYGGGKKCKEIANKYNLTYVNDLMTDKKHSTHGKD